MNLKRDGDRFVFECTYDEKEVPKGQRFWWDKRRKYWWTDNIDKAVKLVKYADDSVRSELEEYVAKIEAVEEMSRSTEIDIDIPAPEGLEYFGYQKAGIWFAHGEDRPEQYRNAAIIGDEMGLGKTIQAIGLINLDTTIERVLVICPASLKLNWQAELKKWLTRPLSVGVAIGKSFPPTDIVVINYDILRRNRQSTHYTTWDLMVVDECFPAGTMVETDKGRLSIDCIVNERLPVSVLSVSDAGRTEYKPVIRFIRKPEPSKMISVKHDSGEFVCTGNHKIFVEGSGYVRADQLVSGDKLCLVRNNMSKTTRGKVLFKKVRGDGTTQTKDLQLQSLPERNQCVESEKILFESVSRRIQEEAQDPCLSNVWNRIRSQKIWCKQVLFSKMLSLERTSNHTYDLWMVRKEISSGWDAPAFLQHVLFGTMESNLSSIISRTNNGKIEEVWEKQARNKTSCCIRENETHEFRPRISRQSGCCIEEAKRKDVAWSEGRKWNNYTTARQAENGVGFTEISNGVHNFDSIGQRQVSKSAELLQGGSGISRREIGYRSRWEDSQIEEVEISGSAQGISLECVRVESVEVLERGSGQRYGDSFVYNIEVADNHNYFADGILVGNCHYIKNPDAKRTQAILGRKAQPKKHIEAKKPIPARKKLFYDRNADCKQAD